MSRASVIRRLANRIRVVGIKRQQAAQRVGSQMWLVAENNRPRVQPGFPASPACRANNGTKHASLWLWIFNAILRREAQAPQFVGEWLVPRPANNGDLLCVERLPLLNQMTDDGRIAPRQQQFGPPHTRRCPRSQNDHSERKTVHGAIMSNAKTLASE